MFKYYKFSQRFISRRMIWAGHAACTGKLAGKPEREYYPNTCMEEVMKRIVFGTKFERDISEAL
jgi:hypothetical protein